MPLGAGSTEASVCDGSCSRVPALREPLRGSALYVGRAAVNL